MDCSPPGSSVHEISQARMLAWVAISFPRGSLTQGLKPGLLHYRCLLYCRWILHWLNQLLFTLLSHWDPHGLKHAKLNCPSVSSGVCSNSWPLSQWCHPTISPSSLPSIFPSIRVFSNELFESGGQSIGASASASVLPVNIQGKFPLRLTDLISL